MRKIVNISHINTEKLIPHKEPFVMIGELLECNKKTTRTNFIIKKENIFLENNLFQQVGMLENVAQTCAARIGFLSLNNVIDVGFIGSISNFRFTGESPKVGDVIETKIVVENEIGNITLLRATIENNSKIIGEGKMKVVLIDN